MSAAPVSAGRADASPFVLLSDSRIAAVPAGDNGEPLVDLREVPELLVDSRMADAAGAYALLREGVTERLLAAQRTLPDGLRLLVIEAYRPLGTQRAIFEGYRRELRRAHPDWSPRRLHVEASKFVSPPAVAPHSTGGTVDLTLCAPDGVEFDMGTAVNATPEASRDACFTDAPAVRGHARHHRTVLAAALRQVGMVNYPTEWWHWSYGDRYWAWTTAAAATVYGPVESDGSR